MTAPLPPADYGATLALIDDLIHPSSADPIGRVVAVARAAVAARAARVAYEASVVDPAFPHGPLYRPMRDAEADERAAVDDLARATPADGEVGGG